MSTHTLYTKEELEAELALWKKALRACATGKSYTIDGQTLTRQNMADIRAHIDFLLGEKARLENRASTVFVKPRFVR